MDDIAVGCLAFVAAFIAFAFVMTGVLWLVINFWWVFLIIGVAAAAWLIYRHPGVKAKREIKAAVKRGIQARQDIRAATEQTKAEMDRIARDWNER